MITSRYCQTMARYNRWQNQQVLSAIKDAPLDVLTQDRGAFFGSILATLSHLVWGDAIWMSRFDGGEKPTTGIPDSVGTVTSVSEWSEARARMDQRIQTWADGLTTEALSLDLNWYSGALGRDVTKPLSLCVTHMFNHQTHHRGQVHAMLTAAGLSAPVSDLFAMPDDGL